VETKHILHRDISWANILINQKHSEGPDEINHDFQFIDNILDEPLVIYFLFFSSFNLMQYPGVPRVQVLLMDFDNAMIIDEAGKENQEHDGTKQVSRHYQAIQLLSYNVRASNMESL
jgi:serine/threonine protein kinase